MSQAEQISDSHHVTGPVGAIARHATVMTETGVVPLLLVNGLGITVSYTEIMLMLTFSNLPVAAVVIAPSMAKTMAETLLKVVSDYENSTGQVVKSLSEFPPSASASGT